MNDRDGDRMRLNNRGYSLAELLVSVAIFGIISVAILDLYVNVVRSTTSSEEIVEVQQGMRLALERIARDIQMSGFLVSSGIPVTNAANDTITLATASAFNTFARIETPITFTVANGTDPQTITVGNSAMAQNFSEGNYVRIVSPATAAQSNVFKVVGVNTSSLRMELLAAPTSNLVFANADVIVQVPSPADDPTFPNAVTYELVDDPVSTTPDMKVLCRVWRSGLPALTAANYDSSERVLATKITDLRFEYLMNDGTIETAVVSSRLNKIVGVRITLTGLAEEMKTRETKTRELQTTVKIRNI